MTVGTATMVANPQVSNAQSSDMRKPSVVVPSEPPTSYNWSRTTCRKSWFKIHRKSCL